MLQLNTNIVLMHFICANNSCLLLSSIIFRPKNGKDERRRKLYCYCVLHRFKCYLESRNKCKFKCKTFVLFNHFEKISYLWIHVNIATAQLLFRHHSRCLHLFSIISLLLIDSHNGANCKTENPQYKQVHTLKYNVFEAKQILLSNWMFALCI